LNYNQTIKLVSNPSSERLNFLVGNLTLESASLIEVFDEKGALLLRKSIQLTRNSNFYLDITTIISGHYFITITNKNHNICNIPFFKAN
jgi:hypothetical protein